MTTSQTIGTGSTSAATRLTTLLVSFFLLAIAGFAGTIYFAAKSSHHEAEVARYERELEGLTCTGFGPTPVAVPKCRFRIPLEEKIEYNMYRRDL